MIKFKNSIFFITLLFSIMLSSICFASIPDTEVSLGGIYYQADENYITNIYGEPNKKTSTTRHPIWKGKIDVYSYGSSLQLILKDGKVIHITSNSNNGLSTPSGIMVGMGLNDITTIYGTGKNNIDKYGNINSVYYASDSNNYIGLKFTIKNEIITEIDAGIFD